MDEEYIERHTVRGQYGPGKIRGQEIRGYREEPNVAPDSVTPTFFAAKLCIDSWRWAGVPFYIRTGKRLSRRLTEISVHFKQPPLKLLGRACDVLESNCLAFCIQPEEHIVLSVSVKEPGVGDQPHTVRMEFNYETTFGTERHYPYERLLLDCLKGDLILFARQDGVEAMWSVVEPIISYWDAHPPTDFPNYASGSWGPRQAHELMAREDLTWRIS